MRRALGDAAMSVGALAVLLLTLVAFDDRVRDQIALRVATHPVMEVANAGRQLTDLTTVVFEAVRYQSIAHAPLVIFVFGATVLLVFMLRT